MEDIKLFAKNQKESEILTGIEDIVWLVLASTLHTAPTVWPHTTYHENYTS